MSVGKRIYLKREMPDLEVMKQFKTIPASNTADVMSRNSAMNPRINLVSKPHDQMMVGPAFTVKSRAGDNLLIHAALNFCNEGDVVVISNEEDNTRALIGEVMMAYLMYQKKIAGIVIDGPIRDIDEIGNWDFPVYCTGTTPGGPYKEGPGEINVPISCGGISIDPGDIILGDPDGVICIPKADAAVILEDAKKFKEADEAKLEKSKNGTSNRDWVIKSLEAKDFEIIDDVYKK
ncbi:MAG: RraA family protein [Lachnospiraceae bacterium]|jgi:regulator of RNase E activity RraA|nr:RraA family protein [Lachnospiraceae bacterium]